VVAPVVVPFPKTPEVFGPQAQGLPGTVLDLIETTGAVVAAAVVMLADLEQPARFQISAITMIDTAMVVRFFFITHLL
jgi:hypothetical protein